MIDLQKYDTYYVGDNQEELDSKEYIRMCSGILLDRSINYVTGNSANYRAMLDGVGFCTTLASYFEKITDEDIRTEYFKAVINGAYEYEKNAVDKKYKNYKKFYGLE